MTRATIQEADRADFDLVTLNEALSELSKVWIPKLRNVAHSIQEINTKEDGTAQTEYDVDCELAHRELFASVFPASYFIGEEHAKEDTASPSQILSSDFISVCDPIDGTANFIGKSKWYAPSVGTYKKTQRGFTPVHGSVFFPHTGEHYFTAHGKVLRFDEARNETTTFTPTLPSSQRRLTISVYNQEQKVFPEKVIDSGAYDKVLSHASISDIMRIGFGEIDAGIFAPCWWDFAGAEAVVTCLGVKTYDAMTLEPKEAYAPHDFETDNRDKMWRLKEPVLICREETLPRIKELMD